MHKQWTYRHIGIHPRVPPTGFRSVNETLPDDLLLSTSSTTNQPRARQRTRSPSRSPAKKSHLATLYASDNLILNGLADDCLHEITASTASKPGGRGGAGKPGSPPYGIALLPSVAAGAGGRRASRSAMTLGTNASRTASVTFEKQRATLGEDNGVVSSVAPVSGSATAVAAGALPKIGSSMFAGGRCGTVRELDSVGNGRRGNTTSRGVSRADGLDAMMDWGSDGAGGFLQGNSTRSVGVEESFSKKYKDMVKPKELVSEEASALESVEKSKMFVHSVAEDFDTYLNTIPSIDPMLEVDERLRKMSMETSSQQQQQQQQQQLNLDASQQLTPREATPLQLVITDGAAGLGASSQALTTFATNDLFSSDSVADKPGSPPSGTGAATTGESPFIQTVMTQLYPTLSKQTSFLTSLVLQVQPELHAPAELLHYIEHDLGFPLDLYCPASWPNMFTFPSHMVAATVGIPKHNAPNTALHSKFSSTIKVVKQPRRPSFIYRRSISMGPASSASAFSATRRASQRAGSFAVGNRSRKASRANSILIRSRRGTTASVASHSGDKSNSNPSSQPGSRPGSQPNSRPGSGSTSTSEAPSRHSQSPSRASNSRVVSATSSAILAKLAVASAEANESARGHASPTEKSGYSSPLSAAPMVPTVVVADGGSDHGSKGLPVGRLRHARSSAAAAVSIVSPDSMPTLASASVSGRRASGSAGRANAHARRNFPLVHYPPIRVKVQKRKARRVDDLYTRELDIIAPTDTSNSRPYNSKSKPKRDPATIHTLAPWYRPPHHWYSSNRPAPSDAFHASLSNPASADTRNDKRTAVSLRLAQLTERSRAEFLALESKYRLEDSGFNDSNGLSASAGFGGAGGGGPSARKSVSAASTAAGIDRRKSAAVAAAVHSRSGSIAVAAHHGHGSGSAASGGEGAFE